MSYITFCEYCSVFICLLFGTHHAKQYFSDANYVGKLVDLTDLNYSANYCTVFEKDYFS